MSEKNSKRSEAEQLSFIWQNIDRIATCMMTTCEGPHLHARPMRGLARPEDKAIYFITSQATQKPGEIASNPNACLCFSDVASNTFISLSGLLTVSDDPEKIRALWRRGDDAYFPDGPTNPHALLLTFSPEGAEYWDAPSNPVLIAIEFIRASVVGDKPSLGDNAEVAMK
jgi:general stress protein 26